MSKKTVKKKNEKIENIKTRELYGYSFFLKGKEYMVKAENQEKAYEQLDKILKKLNE